MPPNRWRIGQKSSFAYWSQISPQVERIARALGDSPLLVCEDTMVPTEPCTPELIDAHYKIRDNKPQWLGIYLKPKRYVHDLGGRRFAAQAVAGSKMFYANAWFWKLFAMLFRKTPKCFSVDSHFQLLVSMDMLNFNYLAWACTPAHYIARTGEYEAASDGNLELRGKLLDLQRFEECVEVVVS